MNAAGWARKFDTPIAIDDGAVLTKLRDAGRYVTALPKAEQSKPHWQTAARELLMAAERGGIMMLAEIAMRQALQAGKPKPAPAAAEQSGSGRRRPERPQRPVCRSSQAAE
jgi:hypothetical protein